MNTQQNKRLKELETLLEEKIYRKTTGYGGDDNGERFVYSKYYCKECEQSSNEPFYIAHKDGCNVIPLLLEYKALQSTKRIKSINKEHK